VSGVQTFQAQLSIVRSWLTPAAFDGAKNLVSEYYETPFSGARFDQLAGSEAPNEMGQNDFTAVRALSIGFPSGFVDETSTAQFKGSLGEQLGNLSTTARLEDLSESHFHEKLGEGGPAWTAWEFLVKELKRYRARAPYVAASKLLSAKRPLLIPLEDSLVRKVLRVSRLEVWEAIYWAVRDEQINERLMALRDEVALEIRLPLHRVLDVLAWQKGRGS
jgi:hypothetical protein